MKLKNRLISVAAVLIIAGALLFTALIPRTNETPQIVTTTSVLASIVEDLGAPHTEAAPLVPAGSCPGHFDIKVHHLRLLEESGILLAHGFEEYLPDIKRSVANSDFAPAKISIEGSWLTPDGMVLLYEEVTEELIDKFPEHENFFRERLHESKQKIKAAEREATKTAKNARFAEKKILCNSHLKGFLKFLGFNIAATYGRREDMSPGEIRDLITAGREANIELVIDNMQAGADTGKVFAQELGVRHTAISNFPGVLKEAETLYDTLLSNTAIIKDALAEE